MYTSKIIEEIVGNDVKIPVELKVDSKTLIDSSNSTKQVEEKTMRAVVAWIKQQLEEKAFEYI